MKYLVVISLLFLDFIGYCQCVVTVAPDGTIPGCVQTEAEAQFVDLVNTSFNGHIVKKISGNSNWNGGAYSTSGLSGDGFVETVITQTNKSRIFGLSQSNSLNSNQINSVDYAVVLRNWGGAEIQESGSYKANVANFSIGDNIRISVESGIVKYYKNGVLLYTSTQAPSAPLHVDLAFQDLNGEFSDITITQTTGTVLKAFGANFSENTTQFKWYKNQVLLSENGEELTLNSFTDGDVILCRATPTSGSCAGIELVSNSLELQEGTLSGTTNFRIYSVPEEEGCFSAQEGVIWNANIPGNMDISGENVTKTQGYNTSNGGVYSTNKVYNNGYLQFKTAETNKRKMVGLSAQDGGNSESSIQYAFYLESGGSLVVYENGSWRGSFGSYSASDTMKIAVDNGVVKYYKNSDLLYVSSV